MALINCKECGKSISSEAKACPQCGANRAECGGCGASLTPAQPKNNTMPTGDFSLKVIAGVAMKVIAGVVGFFVVMILIIYFGAQIYTSPTEQKKEAPTLVYNPVAKWGAEKVAAANKVMDMVKHDCNVFEDNGDLVVEMRNYMDDRNALLKYVRAIADTDVILHGAARNIYYYDPAGKKIAKADTTYGVRLEN